MTQQAVTGIIKALLYCRTNCRTDAINTIHSNHFEYDFGRLKHIPIGTSSSFIWNRLELSTCLAFQYQTSC